MTAVPPYEVKFKYANSPSHRIFHVDGMFGANNTRNQLVISFYAERPPAPESSIIQVQDSVATGPEKFVLEDGIRREVDVSVSMDFNLALSFYVWLEDKLKSMATGASVSEEELSKMLESLRGQFSA